MAKDIVIKINVPPWINDKDIIRIIEKAMAPQARKVPADVIRKLFGVEETTWDIKVPENIEEKILSLRKKRDFI